MKKTLVWIAAVLAAITGILKFFDKTPAYAIGRIRSAAEAFWDFITSSVSTPFWLLAVLVLFSLLFLVCVGGWIYNLSRGGTDSWRDYVRDNLLGLVWRWNWGRQSGDIYNLAAYCPSCDTALTAMQDYEYDNSGNRNRVTRFNCSECGFNKTLRDGHYDAITNRVERIIDKNVRDKSAAEAAKK